LYYRAHHLAGNTGFVHALADAVEAAGGQPLPVFCSSLRTTEPELIQTLKAADAIVVTVLAAGGLVPATAGAGGTEESWDVGALASLDVPILQGLCLTSSRDQWAGSDEGLTPLDAATQVAIPEFDGRLITVPFSFKEVGPDGLTSYVPDPERTARVAGLAVKHARLRHIPGGAHRALSRPTRPSKPASATRSAWTPPHRSSRCSERWPTPATTSAEAGTSSPAWPTGTAMPSSTRSSPPAARTRTG
jgi:cobaltochelatase CobN